MKCPRLANFLTRSALIVIGSLTLLLNQSHAQIPGMPEPTAEHELLKHEVGTWNADATFFTPVGEVKATGKEVNRMVGDFWIVSDFEMDMGGMPFQGHGTFGYDVKTKKYTGSWIDSMSPHVAHMTGTWDESTRTFTYTSEGLDMMGNPEKAKMSTTLSPDNKKRTFVRWVQAPDSTEWTKSMEVVYTKAEEKTAAPAR
jgi:hypothetical protein